MPYYYVIIFLKIVTNTHQAEFTPDLFNSSQEKLPVSEIVFEVPKDGLNGGESFEVLLATFFTE